MNSNYQEGLRAGDNHRLKYKTLTINSKAVAPLERRHLSMIKAGVLALVQAVSGSERFRKQTGPAVRAPTTRRSTVTTLP